MNARNNILPVFEKLEKSRGAKANGSVRVEHFPAADHCDFENPTTLMANVLMCREVPVWTPSDHSAMTVKIADRAKDALMWMASE